MPNETFGPPAPDDIADAAVQDLQNERDAIILEHNDRMSQFDAMAAASIGPIKQFAYGKDRALKTLQALQADFESADQNRASGFETEMKALGARYQQVAQNRMKRRRRTGTIPGQFFTVAQPSLEQEYNEAAQAIGKKYEIAPEEIARRSALVGRATWELDEIAEAAVMAEQTLSLAEREANRQESTTKMVLEAVDAKEKEQRDFATWRRKVDIESKMKPEKEKEAIDPTTGLPKEWVEKEKFKQAARTTAQKAGAEERAKIEKALQENWQAVRAIRADLGNSAAIQQVAIARKTSPPNAQEWLQSELYRLKDEENILRKRLNMEQAKEAAGHWYDQGLTTGEAALVPSPSAGEAIAPPSTGEESYEAMLRDFEQRMQQMSGQEQPQ